MPLSVSGIQDYWPLVFSNAPERTGLPVHITLLSMQTESDRKIGGFAIPRQMNPEKHVVCEE
jgi:hypothetical protein